MFCIVKDHNLWPNSRKNNLNYMQLVLLKSNRCLVEMFAKNSKLLLISNALIELI